MAIHTYIRLVANPARDHFFPCPRSRLRIWSRETGSAVPSPASPPILLIRLNLVFIYRLPPAFRDDVHVYIVNRDGSVPSLSGHAIAYRWRLLSGIRRHWTSTSSPQGSSNNVFMCVSLPAPILIRILLFCPPVGYFFIYPTTWISRQKTRLITVHA